MIVVAVMIALIAAIEILGYRGMAKINAGLRNIYENSSIALVRLSAVERNTYRLRQRIIRLAEESDVEKQGRLISEIKQLREAIDKNWREYAATSMDAEEKGIAAAVSDRLGQYWAYQDRFFGLISRGDLDEAKRIENTEGVQQMVALMEPVQKDIAFQEREAKAEYEKGLATFENTSLTNLVSSLVGVAVALFLALSIVREITASIKAMASSMLRLAENDLSVQVPGQGRGDEIGEMSKAVEVFKLNAIERQRLEAEEKAQTAQREARQRKIESLTSHFDDAVTSLIGDLTEAGRQMKQTATALTTNAEETRRQSASVSSATEEASTNVNTISAASEEMLASIREIGQQVHRSATIAAEASREAAVTNQKMEELNMLAGRIGEVVTLISTIASQTNLLALNATIEAARAGDAGKGFAVVAGEVKNLATQTARATGEITGQISAIQTETGAAVEAIHRIGTVIGNINEMASAIASAVEEQGAAMQEVVRNVAQAAAGTEEVTRGITQVAEATGNTGRMAGDVRAAAEALAEQSGKLKTSVEVFLDGVKTT